MLQVDLALRFSSAIAPRLYFPRQSQGISPRIPDGLTLSERGPHRSQFPAAFID
jgi:hypothetical protein